MNQNKTALFYNGKAFSYEWLDKKTAQLAQSLTAAAENHTIALMLADPFEMALGVLAGFRTKLRIYLLHPASTFERVEALQSQGIPVMMTLDRLSPRSASVTAAEQKECTLVFPTSNTTSAVTRWVEIPSRYLIKKAEMLKQVLHIEADDCSYLVSPLCFIQSCWALFIHLMSGASVWIDSFSTETMLTALLSGRITTFITVPSIARTLVRTAERIGSLRLLVLGGDFADKELIDGLRRRWPNLNYANVYGCTETAAADLILGPVCLRDSGEERYSLGQPSWYSEVSVYGTDKIPLPPGAIGTIWVKSPFLCQHYLGSATPLLDGDRGFCTNDMGYMDMDGFFHYCGRGTGIMKCNGIKLSSLEIECALLTHPQIQEALVFALPHRIYGQIPACCVVLDGAVSSDDIQQYLKGRLEPYKIPRVFYQSDELPKTVSGKLCRNADAIDKVCKSVLE